MIVKDIWVWAALLLGLAGGLFGYMLGGDGKQASFAIRVIFIVIAMCILVTVAFGIHATIAGMPDARH
jgi:hypothetical protein